MAAEEEVKDLEQRLEVPQVSFQRDAVAKVLAALLAQVHPHHSDNIIF